jgi:hypothetical protein
MKIQAVTNGAMFNSTSSVQANSKELNANNSSGTTTVETQKSAASTSTASSAIDLYYDVRDTNKDGIVSPEEEISYALNHPGGTISSRVTNSKNTAQISTQYNQQGSLRVSDNTLPGLINISV